MSLISQFRSDFSSGLFAHTKLVWFKYCIVYAIQYGISTIIALSVVLALFDFSIIKEFIEDPEAFGAMIAQSPELLFSVFKDGVIDWALIAGVGGIAFILLMLLSSWMYNIYFGLNDAQIRSGNSELSEILKNSFNHKIWLILGGTVLVALISVVLTAMVALSAQLHPILVLPIGFLMAIILLRLILMTPGIVHGDLNVGDALKYSWDHINFRRASLLFLIGLAAVIVLIIVGGLYFVIIGLLSLIPILGIAIQIVGSILFSAVLYALIYSGLSGLYFRYSSDNPDESGMQLEDHLVSP